VAERLGFLPTNQKLTRRLKIKKDTDPLASPFFHFSLVKSLPTADVQWKPKEKNIKPTGNPLFSIVETQRSSPFPLRFAATRDTKRDRKRTSGWYFGFDIGYVEFWLILWLWFWWLSGCWLWVELGWFYGKIYGLCWLDRKWCGEDFHLVKFMGWGRRTDLGRTDGRTSGLRGSVQADVQWLGKDRRAGWRANDGRQTGERDLGSGVCLFCWNREASEESTQKRV